MNSFGLSGTSVNIIIEEAPEAESVSNRKKDTHQRKWHVLALSAKGEDALIEKVRSYCNYIDNNRNVPIEDICYTSNVGRSHFSNRAAFVADNLEKLRNDLNEFVTGSTSKATESSGNFYSGTCHTSGRLKTVFIFSSEMNDLLKIAKNLYDLHTKFKEILESCDELIKKHFKFSLIENIKTLGNMTIDFSETVVREACLLAIQYSLFSFWRSLGIKPDAVLGEKIGELSAACAAEIMSLETALELVSQEIFKVSEHKSFSGRLNPPKVRFLSGRSSKEIDSATAVSLDYWKEILESNASKKMDLQYLTEQGYELYINIGNSLCDIHNFSANYKVIDSVFGENVEEALLTAIAKLYCMGESIQWSEFEKGSTGRKIPLPTYPFQRKSYWSEAIIPTRPVDYTSENIYEDKRKVYTNKSSTIASSTDNIKKDINTELVEKLNSVTLQEGIDILHAYIKVMLSGLLNIAPSDMDITESLWDMGVDSIMAIVIKNRIENELNLSINIGILDQGTSITHLAEVLIRSFSYIT